MSAQKQISSVVFANNTDADLSMFRDLIMDAIKNGTPLSDEISDMFSLTIVDVADGIRGIIDWA